MNRIEQLGQTIHAEAKYYINAAAERIRAGAAVALDAVLKFSWEHFPEGTRTVLAVSALFVAGLDPERFDGSAEAPPAKVEPAVEPDDNNPFITEPIRIEINPLPGLLPYDDFPRVEVDSRWLDGQPSEDYITAALALLTGKGILDSLPEYIQIEVDSPNTTCLVLAEPLGYGTLAALQAGTDLFWTLDEDTVLDESSGIMYYIIRTPLLDGGELEILAPVAQPEE